MTPWLRSRTTLFRQLVALLSALILAFVVLESAMVVAMYAADADGLAQDIVDLQTERVFATPAGQRPALRPPEGVHNWDFEVTEHPAPGPGPYGDGAGLISWTRLDRIPGDGVRITGVRVHGQGDARRWVRVRIDMDSVASYLPAILKELGDHVAGPFVPLVLALLAFTILWARRLLGPLERAVVEVEALAPGRDGQRLTVPGWPSEVRGLVIGFNGALERTDAAIDQLKGFTAHVAHDLRTPLSILTLAVAEAEPPEVRGRLQEDLASMTRLVNQLLDLVKAGALTHGQGRSLDLGQLAREVVARMAPLVHEQGREVGVTDLGGPHELVGHHDALAGALRNLIENALKHGEGEVEVMVGEGLRLAVRDHGPGVQDVDAERMFQRFWRKGSDDASGTGLGLEIVRTVTLAHGGTVSAFNAGGGGAVFSMDFSVGNRPAVWPEPRAA